MLLVIDNYDSFTFNIVQYLRELGADVEVVKNDAVSLEGLRQRKFDRLVVSPGPCTPNESGISLSLVNAFAGELPILGVCLGHQCIGQSYGARVVKADNVMHGKTSFIYHTGEGVFAGLKNPFQATRYHSLVIAQNSLPDDLRVTAWTQNDDGGRDEIMGVSGEDGLLQGVQFHPESILTEGGHQLLQNFLDI